MQEATGLNLFWNYTYLRQSCEWLENILFDLKKCSRIPHSSMSPAQSAGKDSCSTICEAVSLE